MTWKDLGHVTTAGWRTLRHEGLRAAMRRASGKIYEASGGGERPVQLFPQDIADAATLSLPTPASWVERGSPVKIGWVTTPPAFGSGGHTTMFRMVTALERAGHQCVLFLYDRHNGDMRRHESTVRGGWPEVRAVVRDATKGISDVDVAVATSWESAHAIAKRGTEPMRRAYFIQDYEPFFYPRGWEYELAEDTYRFGFRCIALGPMVQGALLSEVGIQADLAEFGSDTSQYSLDNLGDRNGVVFFARPGFARRGYQLGKLALEQFHARHPEQTIHVYGSEARDLTFPVKRHGRISPSELNELYNQSIAGLALSFTNVSLVPEEMLAAGVIPVCNEYKLARACLTNPNVVWTRPTPTAIADRLGQLVSGGNEPQRAQLVASSVRRTGWGEAERAVVRIVESEAYGTGT